MIATIEIIDQLYLLNALKEARRVAAPGATREILEKAREMRGLTVDETAVLLANDDPETRETLFAIAAEIRSAVAGRRISLFAPLYLSNACCNECAYCAFRVRHREQARRALNRQEITAEARALAALGHRRATLVCGAVYPGGMGFDYVLDAIDAVRQGRSEAGELREINVNVPPLDGSDFRRLAAARVAGYQLSQETYHREMYASVHVGGPKRDFDDRITAVHHARHAGIEHVGIGVLLGLYNWHFEALALLSHATAIERDFGSGPVSISLSRLAPAHGSAISYHPPYAVTDAELLKLVAVLRLALPYTGQVLAHEEPASIREDALRLGITEMSAAGRCEPGAYASGILDDQSQLADHRSLEKVARELTGFGFEPTFAALEFAEREPANLASLVQ